MREGWREGPERSLISLGRAFHKDVLFHSTYLSEYVCQIWLRSDGRVEKGDGYTQTDRQRDTAALYSRYYFCTCFQDQTENSPFLRGVYHYAVVVLYSSFYYFLTNFACQSVI